MFDGWDRSWIDAHGATAISLAVEYRNGTGSHVNVLWCEVEGFADSETRAVHDGDKGAVPDAGGRVPALIQDGEHLFGGEDLSGEREPLLWWFLAETGTRECCCSSHEVTVCGRYDISSRVTLYDREIIVYNKYMDIDRDLYLLVAGAQLRRRREAIGLTLAEVSQRSGVTVAHLSRIENGLTDPRLSTLQRVLDAIGADFADVSTPGIRTVSVATAIERRDAGRKRVGLTNLGTSDADARLDQRKRRGGDVDDERAGLDRHG